MAKSKRQVLLTDPRVQWAIVRQSLLHNLCHSLIAVTFFTTLQILFGGIFNPWSEHSQVIYRVAVAVFVSLILFLPCFIYESFRLSNRFVEPVKRLRSALRELAEGKPFSPIKFRKGDYWQEMAEELNLAVEALRKQRLAEEAASSDDNENSRLDALETVAS
jgi:hypothetical protein